MNSKIKYSLGIFFIILYFFVQSNSAPKPISPFNIVPGKVLLGTAVDLPNILFTTSQDTGGFGRLVYSNEKKNYYLLDGQIHSYMKDKDSIRNRIPGERSGSSANPENIVGLNNYIYSNSFYNQINKIDPSSGEINSHTRIGNFAYQGSFPTAIFTFGSAILVKKIDKVIAMDSDLKILDQESLNSYSQFENYIQDGGKIYSLRVDNPNASTDCSNPDTGGMGSCNYPTSIIQTTIDFGNPNDIKVHKKADEIPVVTYYTHRAISEKYGWIVVSSDFGEEDTIELHPSNNLAKISASLPLPDGIEIVAMTKTDPIWIITKTPESKYLLNYLRYQDNQLSLKSQELSWLENSSDREIEMILDTRREKLFIATGYNIAVYNLDKEDASLLLHQEFSSYPSLTFNRISLAEFPISKVKSVNRSVVENILNLERIENNDLLLLEGEINKLTGNDKWAINLFMDLLKSKKIFYLTKLDYCSRVLALFGEESKAVLPIVLEKYIISPIGPTEVRLASELIKKVDPTGKETIVLSKPHLKNSFKRERIIRLLKHIGSQEALEAVKELLAK
jgi:hypothetical protein